MALSTTKLKFIDKTISQSHKVWISK